MVNTYEKESPPTTHSIVNLIAVAIAASGIAALPACDNDSDSSNHQKVQKTEKAEDPKLAAASAQWKGNVEYVASILAAGVNLCFSSIGGFTGKDLHGNPTSCSDDQDGGGDLWDLKQAVATMPTDHIEKISIKNGVITLTSYGININGSDSFSLILAPASSDKKKNITWKIDPASTCLAAGLCNAGLYKVCYRGRLTAVPPGC